MDVDFLQNDSSAPKLTRHNLGIGLPEAKRINKYTETNTVRDLVSWYFKRTWAEGTAAVNDILLNAICSSKRAAKVIELIILIGRSVGLYSNHIEVDE